MPMSFILKPLRKIKALHRYDCLRANKAMAAWGVRGTCTLPRR